jgi:hypothetical protein
VKRWVPVVVISLIAAGAALYMGMRIRHDERPEPAAVDNPFGMFLRPTTFSLEERIRLSQELGVRYFRSYPALVPVWEGTCSECSVVHDAGLDFVLTIRNTPNIKEPASPVTDFDTYRKTVGEIIDAYDPSIVAIESEEDTRAFFSGTAEQYAAQLRVGCEAAHERGIPCANGGILSGSVTYVVYQHYVDAGQDEAARSFAERAWEEWQLRHLSSPDGEDHIRFIVDHVTEFLATYKDAGADYVNFHWYQSDDRALEEAVAYLEEFTGLPAMINELGQRNLVPENTTRIVQKVVDLGLPFAVWYSMDTRLARSLVERDGSLRVTGEAFRSALQESVP